MNGTMVSKEPDYGSDILIVSRKDEKDCIITDVSIERTGDLETIGGRDLMIQAIRHRLLTRKGELSSLGHPEYGSLLEEIIGEPNTPDTHRIMETLVRDSLKYEPRIENIITVTAYPSKERSDVVFISVHVKLVNVREELNVSYPVYLEG